MRRAERALGAYRSVLISVLLVTSSFGAILALAGGSRDSGVAGTIAEGAAAFAKTPADRCPHAGPVPAALRLPAVVLPGEPTAIELRMLSYLASNRYQHLGWCVDKAIRDTGPFHHGKYFGTHSAVRILYSPETIAWLRAGKHGVPADGAVIIKEQYAAPAARWAGTPKSEWRPTDRREAPIHREYHSRRRYARTVRGTA